jgi:hypothetical protein
LGVWSAGVTDTVTPEKLTAAGAPAMDETAL